MTGSLAYHHAQGFSSLTLFTGLEQPRRTLYLLSWARAALDSTCSRGPLSISIAVDGWTRLPFHDASLELIIVHLDLVPDSAPLRSAVTAELRRVLAPHGECVAVVAHSRIPADARQWSRYRLTPAIREWLRALGSAGFTSERVARIRFDGRRVTELASLREPVTRTGRAHAVAVRMGLRRPAGALVVERISHEISRAFRHAAPITRIQVRKLAKTAAFVRAADADLVVRLPCSPVAIERAHRNHGALEALRRWPTLTQGLLPEPRGRGSVGAHSYFIETRVSGTPRRPRGSGVEWEPQAVQWITALHRGSASPQDCSDAWFAANVDAPLANLERARIEDCGRTAIEWLRTFLRRTLVGRRLPFVRSHGDFTDANCLYDSGGRLSGVVDWELSRSDGLPLLDLLQCFDLPSEYTSDGRWRRAEIVFDAVECRGPLFEGPELAHYIEALGLSSDLVPALLLMHWVDHAGQRVPVRQSDARWFAGRVTGPLRRLTQLARSAPAGLWIDS